MQRRARDSVPGIGGGYLSSNRRVSFSPLPTLPLFSTTIAYRSDDGERSFNLDLYDADGRRSSYGYHRSCVSG